MGKRWQGWARGFAVAALLLAMAAPVRASVGVDDSAGDYLGEATKIKGASKLDAGGVAVLGEKRVTFSPSEFLAIGTSDIAPAQITASTTPGIYIKGKSTYLRWFDNETSKAQVTFRVPSDYASGGTFRMMVGRTGTGIAPAIDFEVFVHADETAFDAAATNQTAVTLTTAIAAGSPDMVTLTVATDFASLAAGNLVTLNVWRDNVNTSTADLEIYYAEFYYD